jgi:two-component system, NarL family, invasion response regulator UvrY
VDDHPLVRSGLIEVIGRAFREVECGEAGSGEEALAVLGSRKWSVIILDIGLPGKDGFAVLQETRLRRPRTPVIILSFHASPSHAERARELGASGYIPKGAAAHEFVRAVRTVLAGKKSFPPQPGPPSPGPELPAPKSLSTREDLTMQALANGMTIREVAEELHLSVKTVATYKRRVLNKLGLKSLAELVRYLRDPAA